MKIERFLDRPDVFEYKVIDTQASSRFPPR